MSFGGIITQAAGKGKFFCGGEMFLSCFLRERDLRGSRVCGGGGGLSSVSLRLTAPSAEGAFGGTASADAAKGLCDRPSETLPDRSSSLYGTQRRQVAAALSAAVTTTPKQENAPTSHGRTPPMQEARKPQTPATLRERGSGGEALLLEKRPLPQHLPHRKSLREGARGRGLLS